MKFDVSLLIHDADSLRAETWETADCPGQHFVSFGRLDANVTLVFTNAKKAAALVAALGAKGDGHADQPKAA